MPTPLIIIAVLFGAGVIAHILWATHGLASELPSHPFRDKEPHDDFTA